MKSRMKSIASFYFYFIASIAPQKSYLIKINSIQFFLRNDFRMMYIFKHVFDLLKKQNILTSNYNLKSFRGYLNF